MDNKEKPQTGIIVAEKEAIVSKDEEQQINDVVAYIDKKALAYKKQGKDKNFFDLLRYRFRDNGMMLFIWGPPENEEKVIARLKQVIAKYEAKKNKKSNSLPFSFKNLLK